MDVGVVTVLQGESIVVEIVQSYVLSEVVPVMTQGQDEYETLVPMHAPP